MENLQFGKTSANITKICLEQEEYDQSLITGNDFNNRHTYYNIIIIISAFKSLNAFEIFVMGKKMAKDPEEFCKVREEYQGFN